MGNAASNASAQRASPGPRPSPRPRQPSLSPSPGNPHPSLRTKKKSLELPDLASLALSSTRGRQPLIPAKSASIPIPAAPHPASAVPGEAGRTRAPITLPSTTDVQLLDHHPQPATHHQFPPPSRADRERERDIAHQRSRSRRIQEMYDQSHQAHGRQSLRDLPFVQETVASTLPVGLKQRAQPELVPVKITWHGGGKSVYLARAGDDDWKGRLAMIPECPGSTIHHATVRLPPGTHHFRFLIDDSWRVADDLPTAVDDQGSLANYVAVSPPSPSAFPAPSPSPPTQSPTQTQTQTRPRPGQSFWSAASDDTSHEHEHEHEHDAEPTPAQPTAPKPHAPAQPTWTSTLPPELLLAAREEEAYLAASEGYAPTHPSSGPTRVAGFVPAPNIPPAPGLPRHLDKLILNARAVVGGGAVVGSGAVVPRKAGGGGRKGRERRDTRDGWRERERDRERGDRRDRDRDRERRVPPPAPPPSEADVEPEPEPSLSPRSPVPSTPTPTDALAVPSTPLPPPSLSLSPPTPTPASLSPHVSFSPTPAHAPAARPLTLSLATDDSPIPLTDDASVLPVPSHVVLHHLSTSAIRNGVLAVGTTTRYRGKYLTSIYYMDT